MRAADTNKTVIALKKAITEDVELQQRIKRIGKKTFAQMFQLNEIETKVLNAYFEAYEPTTKEKKEPYRQTTQEIAYNLHEMYQFTNAQILSYMFTHGYKIYNDGFTVTWLLYFK